MPKYRYKKQNESQKKHIAAPVPPKILDERKMSQSEYQKWAGISVLLYFSCAIAIGLFSYLLLWAFGQIYFAFVVKGVFVIPSDNGIWVIAATISGISLSMYPADSLTRKILKNRYEPFEKDASQKSGLNTELLQKIMAVPAIIVAMVCIYIGATSYSRFTETQIASLHPLYWLKERTYSYQDVVGVQKITEKYITTGGRGGPTIYRNISFQINFSDDTAWVTSFPRNETPPAYYDDILKFVAQQSGVPLEQIKKEE